MNRITPPINRIPIGTAIINGQQVEVQRHPEFARFFRDLFNRVGGGEAFNNTELAEAIADLAAAVAAISLHSLRVTVDFGATWTDKAQTVVTGQAWVTADSEFFGQVLTSSGVDPDETYLLGMRVAISDIVPGVGFTVTAYTEAEATGTYTIMVIGN